MKEYTVFLVPQFNLLVRDPMTMEIMLPKGEVKSLIGKEGRYWRRRIKEGSVKIVKKQSAQKKSSVQNKTNVQKKIQTKFRKTNEEN